MSARASGSSSCVPGASVECSLDGGGFASCASPGAYNGLSDARHMLMVQATDAASRTGKAKRIWTIDTLPPDTAIVHAPPASTASTSASFGAVSTETKSSYKCHLDAATFAPCKKSQTFKRLAPGPHAYDVRALDRAGNPDPSPASYAWTITV